MNLRFRQNAASDGRLRLVGAGLAVLVWLALFAALLPPGCRKPPTAPTGVSPRIVSYSPAVTSMIFDMGLGAHVVGVTGQCELPPGQKRPVVGDTYSVNVEAIASVEPDIVMIQQRSDRFDALRQVRPAAKIEHFEIETLADVADAVERIGKLAGKESVGTQARREYLDKLDHVRKMTQGLPRPKVLFLLAYQYDKAGTGGQKSFVHELIELAGGTDAAGEYKRWADLDAEAVLKLQPDVLVVWTKPGSEEQAAKYWDGFPGLTAPKDRRFVVSDRNWTIPSPKLADLAGQLAEKVHPELKQISNPKSQIPNKRQTTSDKQQTQNGQSQGSHTDPFGVSRFAFAVCLRFGIWDLAFPAGVAR